MNVFRMVRTGGEIGVIVELSYKDILKLLFGRELYLHSVHHNYLGETIIIRQPFAYEAFNITAPKAE